MTCHWTGSVSWNSSTITIRQRRRIWSRAGASWLLQGRGQAAEQVVVAEDAEPALAALQLLDDPAGEADPDALGRVGRGVVRPQLGVRVGDDLAGQLQGGVTGQGRAGLLLAEAPEVEVVDDLGDQVVEALDQRDPGIAVAGDTE